MNEDKIKQELIKACMIGNEGTGDDNKISEPRTRFIRGCEELEVELLSGPDEDIYAAMVEGVLQTWGDHKKFKWDYLSPETRFFVLREALEGRALPLVMEMPKFTFKISGVSRASFDQIARARIGAVFCAKGVRDNSAKDWNVIVPTGIYDDEALFSSFKMCWQVMKGTYKDILLEGRESWQSARSVIGMNVEYSYLASFNYMALRGLCAHRLINTEQEDTVGTVVGIWREIYREFPLLAAYLKPMEDIKKKNLTIEANGLSKIFGLLFGGSGTTQRWPLNQDIESMNIRFNMSGADWKELENQMGMRLPYPNEWPTFQNFDDLKKIDKSRFGPDINRNPDLR
jgi:hypothetical protein